MATDQELNRARLPDAFKHLRSLSVASDTICGYAVLAPSLPSLKNVLPVLLLAIAAGLVIEASSLLQSTFTPRSRSDFSIKGKLYLGAAVATLGVLCSMLASFFLGVAPVYFVAILLLFGWARAWDNQKLRPVRLFLGGAVRMIAFLIGTSAHSGSLYLGDKRIFILALCYFGVGSVLTIIRESESEGGKRWSLGGGLLILLAAFLWVIFKAGDETWGISNQVHSPMPVTTLFAIVGAILLLRGGLNALGTLAPIDIRRCAKMALLSMMLLNTALIFSRWNSESSVIALGIVSALLTIPVLFILKQKDKSPAIVNYARTELT